MGVGGKIEEVRNCLEGFTRFYQFKRMTGLISVLHIAEKDPHGFLTDLYRSQ